MNISKIEEKFYSWVFKNRLNLLFLSVCVLSLYTASRLPYFNLLIPHDIFILGVVTLAVLSLNIPNHVFIKIAIFLLILCGLATFISAFRIAEKLGDISFMVLFISIVKQVFLLKDDSLKKKV